MKRSSLLVLAGGVTLFAHPMGNISVNHHARFSLTARGVELRYVLDFAELPTFELLRSWKLERTSPREQLEAKAREQGRQWLHQLQMTIDGKTVHPKFDGAELTVADGAGNLPVARIATRAHLEATGGTLAYEDRNFPDRAGWKEIVVSAGEGATLRQSSHTDKDTSKGLTEYPPDPMVAPPQDLRAEMKWAVQTTAAPERVEPKPAPSITAIPQPNAAPSTPVAASPAAAPAAGTVVRGDFLSRMLRQREISTWTMFLGIAAAFVLGAAHALTPGHGKTIVAAYLVGSRGTLKHAVLLGAIVTFTHTITVFALGMVTLFLYRFVMPEKIVQVLGVVSGLSIVAIGAWMLYKRLMLASHTHDHDHDHSHNHAHDQDHGHGHHHHHGPGGHTHMPDEISWAGLVALGASGGLVPCESALILLLGAIALGRVGLGLVLLVSFSLGLALVLMAIGAMVLFAKNLIPERSRLSSNPLFRWVPVASAAVVLVVGLLMTGISLGWTRWSIG